MGLQSPAERRGADEEFILDDRAIRVLHQRRRGRLRIECGGDDKAHMVMAEASGGSIPSMNIYYVYHPRNRRPFHG